MTSSASITITPEKLYAAMAAAGMRVDQEAMDRCIAQAAQRMSDEIDAMVLADLLAQFTEVSLPEAERLALWPRLRTLEPYDSAASFHIQEARYVLDGVRYVAYWGIGTGEIVPFDIAVIKEKL